MRSMASGIVSTTFRAVSIDRRGKRRGNAFRAE
jgi:hypothetical protein